jgi:LysM repeat protein
MISLGDRWYRCASTKEVVTRMGKQRQSRNAWIVLAGLLFISSCRPAAEPAPIVITLIAPPTPLVTPATIAALSTVEELPEVVEPNEVTVTVQLSSTGTILPTLPPPSQPSVAATIPPPTLTGVLPPGWVLYIVRAGDTLGGLARCTDTTVEAVRLANQLPGHLIMVGQAIYLPRSCSPPPTISPVPNPPTTTPSPPPTATASPVPTATPTLTPTITASPSPTEEEIVVTIDPKATEPTQSPTEPVPESTGAIPEPTEPVPFRGKP